jgi:hypothetical protein
MHDFELAPLPWSNERLDAVSQADDETWKRYHEYRTRLETEAAIEDGEDDDAEMEVDNEDDDGKTRVLCKCQEALKKQVEAVDYEPWRRHTFQNVDDLQWKSSSTEIRSITTCATVFSPYILPHAIELEHRYHCRPRYTWCEFYCYWHFRLVRFDGEPNGDEVQQRLARTYPKDMILLNPTYVADDDMEVLCSNGYMDPPQIQEEVEWVRVEDIDVHNFTPNTVCRMRDWLFGSLKSTEILSDYDFLRLIFASYGTAGFKTLDGDVGHFWLIHSELHSQLIAGGIVDKDNEEYKDFTGLHWLEYQARLVAGALRPQDKYYVPHDVLAAKSEWGRRVLQVCEPGKYNEDDNEDLSQAPWLVWERAEKSSANLRMAMQLMMHMANRQQS